MDRWYWSLNMIIKKISLITMIKNYLMREWSYLLLIIYLFFFFLFLFDSLRPLLEGDGNRLLLGEFSYHMILLLTTHDYPRICGEPRPPVSIYRTPIGPDLVAHTAMSFPFRRGHFYRLVWWWVVLFELFVLFDLFSY